jgi:hypothetical protein
MCEPEPLATLRASTACIGINLPYWDANSDTSVFQPVASRYADCAIPAPYVSVEIHSCKPTRYGTRFYAYVWSVSIFLDPDTPSES